MIDYKFYLTLGEDTLASLYSSNISASDLFDLMESARSDLPYVDQLETTNNCNLRCRMCPRTNSMTREITAMPMDLFTKIVDEMESIEQEKRLRGIGRNDFLSLSPPSLLWSGSEHDVLDLRLHHFGAPFLDPLLLDRVAYINRNASFGVQLSETVINVKIPKVEVLLKSNLNRLIIALDATNANDFEFNRGRKIFFEREVDKIKEIANLKVRGNYKTKIELQLIKLNTAEARDFHDFWQGTNGITLHYKPFFPYPDIDHSIGKDGDSVFANTCKIPFVSLTVLADGRVVPCNSDYNGEEILGDLKKTTLREIWAGIPFREFRKRFIHDHFAANALCRRCGYYPHYKGKNRLTSHDPK